MQVHLVIFYFYVNLEAISMRKIPYLLILFYNVFIGQNMTNQKQGDQPRKYKWDHFILKFWSGVQ